MGQLIILFQRSLLLPLNMINPIITLFALLNRATTTIDKVCTHELNQWEKQITADIQASTEQNEELEKIAKELAATKAKLRINNKKEATKVTADSFG